MAGPLRWSMMDQTVHGISTECQPSHLEATLISLVCVVVAESEIERGRTWLSVGKTTAVSQDRIIDLKSDRIFREFLPVLMVVFTPITVSYDYSWGPTVSIFFLLGRVDLLPWRTYLPIQVVLAYPFVLLLVSMPALLVSVVSSWELHRLSQRKTTASGVLRAIVAATLAWAIYLFIYFLGTLSVGHPLIGPFPVPFTPLVAVLSREHIMRLTEEIDKAENPSKARLD